jgi:Fic family protein
MEVQQLIGDLPKETSCVSAEFISWIHKEFCSRLPEELLMVQNPVTGTSLKVIPGEWRKSGVQIGRHIPPVAEDLPRFMARFSEVYEPSRHSKMRQVIAAAASHHRLLWIHPFYDGNGRVARLFSDTFMKSIGIGNDLWSVSRGLARTVHSYKNSLAEADMPRMNDLDGRGSLSQKGLLLFCTYFLKTCIDQVEFMGELLDIKGFLSRLEKSCESFIAKGDLLPGSFPIMRELFYSGEIERGYATSLTGYKERQARTVLSKLIKEKCVISDSSKGRIRLNFPPKVVQNLFPNLYPD